MYTDIYEQPANSAVSCLQMPRASQLSEEPMCRPVVSGVRLSSHCCLHYASAVLVTMTDLCGVVLYEYKATGRNWFFPNLGI